MILDRIRNIDSGVFIIADNDKCRIELRMINLKRNMNGRTHPNLRFHQYKKIKGTLLLYRNIEYSLNGNMYWKNVFNKFGNWDGLVFDQEYGKQYKAIYKNGVKIRDMSYEEAK